MKRRTALMLHRFIRYWTVLDTRNQPRIHPTVMIMHDTQVTSKVAIGRYSYVRNGVKLESGSIGSFCSIAPGVIVGGDEHPIGAVSTHPFWYEPGGLTVPEPPDTGKKRQPAWEPSVPAPVIGHDVWIGAGAQILCGAVVEDGAVIGAGAVVKGRIPAYAIAVGVPARVVRYRFDPDTCRRLHASHWWDWEETDIRRMRPYFGDVGLFLDQAGSVRQQSAPQETRAGGEVREA